MSSDSVDSQWIYNCRRRREVGHGGATATSVIDKDNHNVNDSTATSVTSLILPSGVRRQCKRIV